MKRFLFSHGEDLAGTVNKVLDNTYLPLFTSICLSGKRESDRSVHTISHTFC